MGVKLEFTDDELRELTLALEEQRHGLMIELTGADAREFKDRLAGAAREGRDADGAPRVIRRTRVAALTDEKPHGRCQ